MSDILLLTILSIIFIILTILSEIGIIKKFKDTRNNLYLGVILFLTALELYAFFQINEYYQFIEAIIGAALTYDRIIWIIIIIILSDFYFYLKKQNRLYTLPIVIGFFVATSLVLIDNLIALIIYSFIFGFLYPILLVNEGIKNKNGLTFSLGITIITMGMGVFIALILDADIIQVGISIVGIIIFVLGAWGIFDEYIFYDREKEKEIKDTWISTLVNVSHKPGVPDFRDKVVVFMCPICRVTKSILFTAKELEDRYKNPKGIVQILIDTNEICEHSFVVYVDKYFSIRGYESIEFKIQ